MKKQKILENLSLSDLVIIRKECTDNMENWRCVNSNKLSKKGKEYNDKLHIINAFFYTKIDNILKEIKYDGS